MVAARPDGCTAGHPAGHLAAVLPGPAIARTADRTAQTPPRAAAGTRPAVRAPARPRAAARAGARAGLGPSRELGGDARGTRHCGTVAAIGGEVICGAKGGSAQVARALGALALCALAVCVPAGPVGAQDIAISLGDEGSLTGVTLQILLAVTLLSLVPGLAVMVTCFPFIVTVLSILRMAIGLQQSPPNMLIVTLALFLTYFVMDPVLMEAWETGIRPLLDEEIGLEEAFGATMEPFRGFMTARVAPETLDTLQNLRPEPATDADGRPALSVLVPSFLLSEISRAFEIGFVIFLPFLIIDLVVAAVLMSMGMMMVPPAIVSLPFKLAFFVVADGWTLISEALVRGYL